MQLYIDKEPNESGAYSNPKLQPFPGCIKLDEKQAQIFLNYKGFVRVISTEPVAIEPNEQDFEKWKEMEKDGPSDLAPTETEQLRADIDYIALMTGVEL